MKTITLKLDDTSPEKLKLSRVLEYYRQFGIMCGEDEHLQIDAVREGSAALALSVEDSAYHSVTHSIRQARHGLGSRKTRKAYDALMLMMAKDNVQGSVLDGEEKIISFPAPDVPEELAVTEYGSVQGLVYNVGGKDETIPVKLIGSQGETLHCETSDVAVMRQLGQLLQMYVRLEGQGEWVCDSEGGWKLKKLHIERVTKLTTGGIKSAIQELRKLEGLTAPLGSGFHERLLEERR